MAFPINIPVYNADEGDSILQLNIETGSSVIFVGANGSGKTRLAAFIEEVCGEKAQRIAAQRALSLDPKVPHIPKESASLGLKFGTTNEPNIKIMHRIAYKWKGNTAVTPLNDFGFLLQVLYAEQINCTLKTHQDARSGKLQSVVPSTITATKFERLTKAWEELLPTTKLHISGDDIQVSRLGKGGNYSAAQMSDGERSVFYMLGQTLVADDNSLLIIDEPELHIHKAIMAKLWDELEAMRPDCAFLYITHDIDFACSRTCAKYIIHSYEPPPHSDPKSKDKLPPRWDIREIQEESGFDENILSRC